MTSSKLPADSKMAIAVALCFYIPISLAPLSLSLLAWGKGIEVPYSALIGAVAGTLCCGLIIYILLRAYLLGQMHRHDPS